MHFFCFSLYFENTVKLVGPQKHSNSIQGSYSQGKLGKGEENLRKVREILEKQVKSGNFFHGLEKFLFSKLSSGIFQFPGMP